MDLFDSILVPDAIMTGFILSVLKLITTNVSGLQWIDWLCY